MLGGLKLPYNFIKEALMMQFPRSGQMSLIKNWKMLELISLIILSILLTYYRSFVSRNYEIIQSEEESEGGINIEDEEGVTTENVN